jgi:hypothetical protein
MENITVTQESPARRAAVAGLAVVGFFALVFIGMILAIYAARFVPKTANSLSAGVVYLSSVFTPAGSPATLTTVPTSTIPFPESTTTVAVATTTVAAPVTPVVTPAKPSSGTKTTTVTPVTGSGTVVVTAPPAPYGLPNLTVTIDAVGFIDPYGNFVPSQNLLNSMPFAVKFSIVNTGTNVTLPWDFVATLPTRSNSQYTFTSVEQKPLNPGERIEYTLHLDPSEAANGYGLTTSVTADPRNRQPETTKNDNVAVAQVNISNHN